MTSPVTPETVMRSPTLTPVPPNQEEIGSNRKDDGLQSYRNSGGKESGKSRQRTEFADESQSKDNGHAGGR